MHLTVSLSLPSISNALASLHSRSNLVAVLVDLFSVDALEFGKKLNISSHVLFASSCINLSILLYLPTLDEILSSKKGDLSQPVKLPGLHNAEAIAMSTAEELETEVLKTVPEINPNLPVFPVGPIIQAGSTTRASGPGSECLEWLDRQPKNSVLYVCFGSGATLSFQQTTELALGLEMSGHRFLWVVRPPSGSSISTYLSAQKDESDPLKFLPDGFVGRTKDRGFLVQSWCPQIDVMRHESTGGFLTHCGWSSTAESLVYGKPTIVWPLFADQPVNAAMLTDSLKVAIRPEADERDGIVRRGEVCRVVKCLLESEEGKGMYKRVQVIKDVVTTALGEKGSSTKNIESLVVKWMKNSRA
ncbi:hydroquinone glucosyltransferase-like [Senna tora]|uniref:Hydroquinone glucosyltransferase-like n=1 Tax=Senna tora TaxID=362788 RepID=A0A834XKL6_9FABA|nr:hydroquinone glucosyltransferase-like [Senna tora]